MTVHGDDVTAEGAERGRYMRLNGRVPVRTEVQGSNRFMKTVSLLLLTPHYAILILLMRYVRTRPGPMFLTSTTVLLAEVFKTITCLVIIFVQQGGARGCVEHLYEFLVCRPWDFAKVCVPSFLFVLQNNLVFVAISNLDAATFQVTYQLKILTTAIFSVVLLGKRLSAIQWLALLMLFAGVSIIQVESVKASTLQKSPLAAADPEDSLDLQVQSQNYLTGLMAVLACSCLSGFANVYFEVLLKGGKQTVWLRNVQLGLSGTVLGALACLLHDAQSLNQKGFFFGYTGLVWTVVMLQSLGGLLVAAVIKYADNILKGFSTAGSILLSCIASIYIFDFQMDPLFVVGTSFVLLAIYLYSFCPAVQPGTEFEVHDPEQRSAGQPSDRNYSWRLLELSPQPPVPTGKEAKN